MRILRLLVCLAALVVAPAATGALAAQEPAPAPDAAAVRPPSGDTGRLIPRRTVVAHPGMSYAAFLPPGHGTAHAWPALILMDPRGRALVPLERFRPAAAALGYVILSSYDTSSDEPTSAEDTRAAVEAVLNDAAGHLSLDLRRLYLVGFSGTARLAWSMALADPDFFPAIVGFGAGLNPTTTLAAAAVGHALPEFFGGAGTRDFNYSEMWHTDAGLDGLGIRHALAYFPAGHAWPPREVAAAAVEWLEVRAHAAGLAPLDSAWIRARFAAAIEDARALETEGRLHDAILGYRRVLGTFGDLGDVLGRGLEEARSSLDRLAHSPGVRETTERLDRWLGWEAERRAAFGRVDTALEGRGAAPRLDRLVRLAELDEIRRHSGSQDTLGAQAADRAVASLVSFASFYLPRRFLARGDTARALRALELAHHAAPGATIVCARFRALIGAAPAQASPLGAACRPDPVRDTVLPPSGAGPRPGGPRP